MNIAVWVGWAIIISAVAGRVADADPKNYRQLGWLWYITVQLVMLCFTVLGWFLLIPFCLAHDWTAPGVYYFTSRVISINDGRRIDCWKWRPLNWVYSNPEDGVSGQRALVWVNGVLSPYMPAPWQTAVTQSDWRPLGRWLYDAWRAYCWSALRNSCDNLKYVFAWENGPQAQFFGRKLGWWPENSKKVPLL